MLDITVWACLILIGPPDGYGTIAPICEYKSLSECRYLSDFINKRPEFAEVWLCEDDYEKSTRGEIK